MRFVESVSSAYGASFRACVCRGYSFCWALFQGHCISFATPSTRAAEAVLVFHPHPEGRRARFSLAVRLLELVCGDFAFFLQDLGTD